MKKCEELTLKEYELLDYYYAYCELNVWFKKILMQCDVSAVVPTEDIKKILCLEQSRVLKYVSYGHKRLLRNELKTIAEKYIKEVEEKQWALHVPNTMKSLWVA